MLFFIPASVFAVFFQKNVVGAVWAWGAAVACSRRKMFTVSRVLPCRRSDLSVVMFLEPVAGAPVDGEQPHRQCRQDDGDDEHGDEHGEGEHASQCGVMDVEPHAFVPGEPVEDEHAPGGVKVDPHDAGLAERDERERDVAGDDAGASMAVAKELAQPLGYESQGEAANQQELMSLTDDEVEQQQHDGAQHGDAGNGVALA